MYGYAILLLGWIGPLILLLHPAAIGMVSWYANILLLPNLARAAFGRSPSLWLATLALVLALLSFSPLFFWGEVPSEEPVCARGTGFWLWIWAFVVVFVGALINTVEHQNRHVVAR